MFTVIAGEEFAIDSLPFEARVGDPGYNFRDQVVKISKVCIAQGAQRVRDLFWIGDFGANKPERVNERKSDRISATVHPGPRKKIR